MKKIYAIAILILVPAFVQAQQINQTDVSHILKTLSSDAMKGRYTFSPEIWDAADFISDEFSEAGLKPLDGQDGYLQRFSMYSLSVANAQISVDGQPISSNHYFAMVNGENISWTQDDSVLVKQIKAKDNFRAKIQQYSELKGNVVIFVDPSQGDFFNRFKPYFSRATRTFDKNAGYNKVFILSDTGSTFNITLNKKVEEQKLANVAGKIEGKRNDEIVLFSGHYDHLGILKPVEGDSIANGANDDASGTTAVIELAKHFSKEKQPERTLVFAAFTAEEVGGYGSKYFSRQMNPDHIMAMFNIEMIGKPGEKGPNTAWITGFNRSSFGTLLQESAKGTGYTFYADPYPKQNLFYRSDNRTLARLGVPAHSISTTPIDVDKDYHQVTDEVSTINFSHLTNTIEAIARAADGIVSGKHTPTRVDTSKVK